MRKCKGFGSYISCSGHKFDQLAGQAEVFQITNNNNDCSLHQLKLRADKPGKLYFCSVSHFGLTELTVT